MKISMQIVQSFHNYIHEYRNMLCNARMIVCKEYLKMISTKIIVIAIIVYYF